jgi:LmbE family N-acetylglucosaminyl deacetylase
MSSTESPGLEWFPEDWTRGLAVVAHPDDMEFGAAAAVARWTRQGKAFAYALVSEGEAGIATMDPSRVGPIRREEQRASCAIVGVTELEFLGWPDGAITESLELRADLAATIRRHQPEVIVSINLHDTWGTSAWNHADHRAVGRALLDAVRDAANPWVFPDRGEPWPGVRFTAFSGSPNATHAVDVTDTIDLGVDSLAAHRVYLDNLGDHQAAPGDFLRHAARSAGARVGVEFASTFELMT